LIFPRALRSVAEAQSPRFLRSPARMKEEISVSMGTVFVLNSVALLIFPAIGHFLHLSQNQFGIVVRARDSRHQPLWSVLRLGTATRRWR